MSVLTLTHLVEKCYLEQLGKGGRHIIIKEKESIVNSLCSRYFCV